MYDRQTAATTIAEAMHSWKTLRLDVHNDIAGAETRPADGFGASGVAIDYQYIETAAGERKLTLLMTREDGRATRTEYYFDGAKGTTIVFDKKDATRQKQVSISPSFGAEAVRGGTEHPVPLKYYYVGKVPLYEALESAREMGEEVVAEAPCDKYLLEDVALGRMPQNLLYFLRRDDALPVRVESYDGPDPSTANKLWSWEAERVDAVDGRPFVMKSTLTSYAPAFTSTFEVTNLAFDAPVAKSTFRPVISKDARVDDTITGKTRRPAREEPDVPISTPPPPAADVGTAVPPGDWAPAASYTAFGLGAAILAAAVVLMRRR